MWRCAVASVLGAVWAGSAIAANITCTGTPDIGKDYAIPPVNVVLGMQVVSNAPIFQVNTSSPLINNIVCSSPVKWVVTLDDFPDGTQKFNPMGALHNVYKTSVTGLGISFTNFESSTSTTLDKKSIDPWPVVRNVFTKNTGSTLRGTINVLLWKLAGIDLPYGYGTLNFTGPTVRYLLTPVNAGDTISSATLPVYSARYLMWGSRRIVGSTTLINGACELEGGSKTVPMGSFDGSAGGNSDWIGVNFKLKCPNAYGYNGSVSNASNATDAANFASKTANLGKNGPVSIKILPRAGVHNQTTGIMNLDGSGAQGYGIQLAWGDAATQAVGTPAKPVQFDQWTRVNTLNSNYRDTAYTVVGTPAIASGADGTLKMAARYVRTSGSFMPGPANAAVEIIAGYE